MIPKLLKLIFITICIIFIPIVLISCQGGTSDAKNPVVTITMENNEEIIIELYPEIAPNTVNNFIYLIENEFYNGTTFHRVISDFMIQGGEARDKPLDYTITGEFTTNGFENNLKHERGVLSMARTNNPDSANSQFFIVIDNAEHLDGGYASFGKVIEGMETVENVAKNKTDRSYKPLEDQIMKKVTVETYVVNYDEPEMIK